PWRNVRYGVVALISVQLLGSVAYIFIGLEPFEAFYQTLITITTVGFGEIGDEIGTSFRVITSLLIMGGVGVALYTIGAAFEAVIEGRLSEQFGRSRMQKVLDRIHGHVIVCGWGQVGRAISRSLRAQGGDVIVIDRREDLLDVADLPALVGDATDDRVLRQAGIERARGLVVALDSDADCTYVTLSGRALNPNLFIVARANGPSAEPKLRHAGADRVVNPHEIGGARMAAFVTQPNVADFLGEAMHDEQLSVELREYAVVGGSRLDGANLGVSHLADATGVKVLAVRRADGSFDHHPGDSTTFVAGDVPIVLGTREQLDAVRNWLGSD
ncbi:MAG: potassium channel protein, partial [Acidimicrobiia bacterium]|nr:potassium channel protein [Acidimicrobiia bacterium]